MEKVLENVSSVRVGEKGLFEERAVALGPVGHST